MDKRAVLAGVNKERRFVVNDKVNGQQIQRRACLPERVFFFAILALMASAWLTACGGQAIARSAPTAALPQPTSTTTALPPSPLPPPAVQAQAASPVPACTDHTLTPSETEGPYFKAGSPERASLIEPGLKGTKLVLTGFVRTADCQPVAHALLDFWQANAQGQYDNTGYTLRGHQFTDAAGRYQLTTIVPGLYPGRTEHIHVKVQAPNGPILTTQLYFPGVSSNQTDTIFDPKLVMTIQNAGDGMTATFNFVIAAQ